MKKLILSTAALALTAGASPMAQDARAHGHRRRLPSWNFINDAGEVDGFERELGDELCARAELDLHLGDQRMGFDHPQPGVGQLRHHHRRHVDHRRA